MLKLAIPLFPIFCFFPFPTLKIKTLLINISITPIAWLRFRGPSKLIFVHETTFVGVGYLSLNASLEHEHQVKERNNNMNNN